MLIENAEMIFDYKSIGHPIYFVKDSIQKRDGSL